MVLLIGNRVLSQMPDDLDTFFDQHPDLCEANEHLTRQKHVSMGRDKVLFIKQRQQATSDYRENPRVRFLGSHAALTCHIALMRHSVSGVTSIGHFDNFCCWQFGAHSSAHRSGFKIMLDEIDFLSHDGVQDALVEVSVVGGYQDARGDAAKNSMSLLRALHELPEVLRLRHFCVGRYNTKAWSEEENEVVGPHLKLGPYTAILKGLAIDLKRQVIFPAIFDWGSSLSDFKTQIADRARRRMGERPVDEEDKHKTIDSTFKPKSLRNNATSVVNFGLNERLRATNASWPNFLSENKQPF